MLGFTQKLTRSTLALKLSVSPPYYPWVTVTEGMLSFGVIRGPYLDLLEITLKLS